MAKPFNPKDHFFHKAKKEGFLARSAYKLQEIQKKYRVLKPGDHILDLGCAPGAWSQVASQIVGKSGHIWGIDLKPVDLKLPSTEFVQGDVYEFDFASMPPVQVIVSDLAPSTTGVAVTDQARSLALCERVVEISGIVLKPGGHLVMKVFMGPDFKKLELNVKAKFTKIDLFRPESTRKVSTEIYMVALGKK